MSEQLIAFEPSKTRSQAEAVYIACNIINDAIEDLDSDDETLSKSAWSYFKSKEFVRHCELADKDADAFLTRKIYHRASFVRIELQMSKANYMPDRNNKSFKESADFFINNYLKAKSIILKHLNTDTEGTPNED